MIPHPIRRARPTIPPGGIQARHGRYRSGIRLSPRRIRFRAVCAMYVGVMSRNSLALDLRSGENAACVQIGGAFKRPRLSRIARRGPFGLGHDCLDDRIGEGLRLSRRSSRGRFRKGPHQPIAPARRTFHRGQQAFRPRNCGTLKRDLWCIPRSMGPTCSFLTSRPRSHD